MSYIRRFNVNYGTRRLKSLPVGKSFEISDSSNNTLTIIVVRCRNCQGRARTSANWSSVKNEIKKYKKKKRNHADLSKRFRGILFKLAFLCNNDGSTGKLFNSQIDNSVIVFACLPACYSVVGRRTGFVSGLARLSVINFARQTIDKLLL